jgi:cephalosporin-C deacetylase-like acetyl esterase
MGIEPDARDAFERAPNFGLRCATFDPADTSPERLGGPILRPSRDFSREQPVPDRVFEAYRRFYAYDPLPLNPTVVSTDTTPRDWIVQMVSFRAAYGGERVTARVYVPKRGAPPFQAVVFLPGAQAFAVRASDRETDTDFFGDLVRNGRIVIAPTLKGAWERWTPEFSVQTPKDSTLWRDYVVEWEKDVSRTVDYLQTRGDVNRDRIGYFGVSRGAAMAPISLALDPRLKTAELAIPGFYLAHPAPEVDVLNFVPRVKQPVLMLSGRYDAIFPEQHSQVPFFDLLGTPAALKRRVVYDSGHNIPATELIRETLDWFDRHLGQVAR